MVLTGPESKPLKSSWVDALAKAQPELEAAKEKWLQARGAEIAKARNVGHKEGRRIAQQEPPDSRPVNCATISRSASTAGNW